jgi:hypothetical protein
LDELPNSSCYWALPGELLIVAVPRLTGTAAIDDVLPVPLSTLVDLPFSFGCHRSGCRCCHRSGCPWLVTRLDVFNRVVIVSGIAILLTFCSSPAVMMHCTGLSQ